MNLDHIDDYERDWLPRPKRMNEKDVNFTWRADFLDETDSSREMYSVVVVSDRSLQGLLSIVHPRPARLVARDGGILRIDYLAAAPWNRPSAGSSRIYQWVGQALVLHAVVRSHGLQLDGLVGLHSLDGAISFCEGMGFKRHEPDPLEDNLLYMELIGPPEVMHADNRRTP